MYTDDIIDTHMHLWDLKNNYPWLESNDATLEYLGGNYDKLKKNFLVPDYIGLTHKHNVKKSVHLEAFGFAGNPVAETRWLQEQANQFGFPNAIIAHADLHQHDIETVIKQHCQYPNMRGIRMALNYHDNPLLRMTDREDYMQDKQWQKGFALLEKYNLLFEMQIYDHQITKAIELIQAFPQTTIVLEHFAWPLDLSENGFKIWQERMAKIARFNNVYLKVSGIGWVFKKANIETIKNYITTAIKIFGIDRCMFGSNFPADSLFISFDELINTYKTILSTYTSEEQRKFFYDNAKRVYRL
jgi:predicted TIM-barrel fold metal-dependent hydrolase